MLLGWLFFIPFSIIIIRLGSNLNRWFPLHILLALIGVGLIIAGAVFGFFLSNGQFSSTHQLTGVVIVGILFVEIIVGIVISKLWKIDRSTIPWYNKVHWWIGRLVILLAFVNIFLGFNILNLALWMYILTGIVMILWIVVYVSLIVKLPQTM